MYEKFIAILALSSLYVASVLCLPGCDSSPNQDGISDDSDGDVTQTDDDVSDDDTDSESGLPGDVRSQDTETYPELADYQQLCAGIEYEQIDPAWLTEPYSGDWPLLVASDDWRENYNSNFWYHLDCYNAQLPQIEGVGVTTRICYDHMLAEPPNGRPFTCGNYLWDFCDRMHNDETPYFFDAICEDADWSCDRCFAVLYNCIEDRVKECPSMEERSPMYKEMDAFRECYNDVTGDDRCNWVLCGDLPPGACSGAEWPPV